MGQVQLSRAAAILITASRCFCLLEDDNLISKVQVETNRLLTPPAEGEHIHDVHLVIRVKTILAVSAKYEMAFH